ncbi:bifunctional 4-hydroxy-2-oxoglutarate aldolase/2-dehydro-3-deoxy-phosphogluconate aldolase [Microbacterium xanthum]|uniref:bifunctional 4-hydroxy-2-oxoglutarate aldolase/2-dehydro-3-deoxy-phosphogluconate aldolase n=1 Tax=Microbacterium xanthum TaxID=3079794 RepID=UPI002AD58CD8|nr:bifunctional 4-hydroxy-2-oxoglutarate aldolase/2-dehydro-3-deoxy-phosphogluconate aldolase [Microbacterium sp. KSW-48]MDZ8172041.1 bifunctional 4-hydroxy-2-oxoglutarate aldolase/2-dehydro-3-deoxy-phosphogluconate aldolase [Microbacterium sp. KSW-48]
MDWEMNNVVDLLRPHGVIPVVVAETVDHGIDIGEALLAGGLPVAEVTFRTPAAPEILAALVARGDLLVGAGTVTTPAQVDVAADIGAAFLVSPGLTESVADRARERGIPLVPGAATATEVQRARELGFTTLKFFPAEASGGLPAVRALAAPFGDVTFIPTGGIGPDSFADYLADPAVAAVGGSWMLPREAVLARDRDAITRLTAATVARVARPTP